MRLFAPPTLPATSREGAPAFESSAEPFSRTERSNVRFFQIISGADPAEEDVIGALLALASSNSESRSTASLPSAIVIARDSITVAIVRAARPPGLIQGQASQTGRQNGFLTINGQNRSCLVVRAGSGAG